MEVWSSEPRKKRNHENWIAKKDAISIIVKGTIKDPISIILNIIGYELSSSQACICKTLHAQSITLKKEYYYLAKTLTEQN